MQINYPTASSTLSHSYQKVLKYNNKKILLGYPRHSFAAAKRRIVKHGVVSLVDASLAVDVDVADWMLIDLTLP